MGWVLHADASICILKPKQNLICLSWVLGYKHTFPFFLGQHDTGKRFVLFRNACPVNIPSKFQILNQISVSIFTCRTKEKTDGRQRHQRIDIILLITHVCAMFIASSWSRLDITSLEIQMNEPQAELCGRTYQSLTHHGLWSHTQWRTVWRWGSVRHPRLQTAATGISRDFQKTTFFSSERWV